LFSAADCRLQLTETGRANRSISNFCATSSISMSFTTGLSTGHRDFSRAFALFLIGGLSMREQWAEQAVAHGESARYYGWPKWGIYRLTCFCLAWESSFSSTSPSSADVGVEFGARESRELTQIYDGNHLQD